MRYSEMSSREKELDCSFQYAARKLFFSVAAATLTIDWPKSIMRLHNGASVLIQPDELS